MSTPVERIPIPPQQRRELLRERVLPVACFLATAAACAALWRYQYSVAPLAIGEVHSDSVVINSPCDGVLVALVDDAAAASGAATHRRTFDEVESGQIAARVRCAAGGEVVDVPAPIAGQIVSSPARLGQLLRQGEPILTIASPKPDFIVCHLTARGGVRPAAGQQVAVRKHEPGARWFPAKVEAVGAVIELAPTYNGSLLNGGERGLPVRISLPRGLTLTPGGVVEVRFPSTASL